MFVQNFLNCTKIFEMPHTSHICIGLTCTKIMKKSKLVFLLLWEVIVIFRNNIVHDEAMNFYVLLYSFSLNAMKCKLTNILK